MLACNVWLLHLLRADQTQEVTSLTKCSGRNATACFHGDMFCWCANQTWLWLSKTPNPALFTTAHLCGAALMTGCDCWLMPHVSQSAISTTTIFLLLSVNLLLVSSNDYWDWCHLPRLIIPSHITLKPRSPLPQRRVPVCHAPLSGAHILQSVSSRLHASPAVQIQIERLVIFSSCGVGLWYIKAHWGLAASVAVWFDAAWPCPWVTLLGAAQLPPFSPPSSGTDASSPWPHKDSPHMEARIGLLSIWGLRSAFHLLPSPLSSSSFQRCVCFTQSVSS